MSRYKKILFIILIAILSVIAILGIIISVLSNGYYISNYSNKYNNQYNLSFNGEFINYLVGQEGEYELSYNKEDLNNLGIDHIIYLKTKDTNQLEIRYMREGLYLSNNDEYIVSQNIDIYYEDLYHPLNINFSGNKGSPNPKCQVQTTCTFYPTINKFDKNTVNYEYYVSSSNSSTTILVIKGESEIFGYISYKKRYVNVDDNTILNTILDNLIII